MTARKKHYAAAATVFLWLYFIILYLFEGRYYSDPMDYYFYLIPTLFCIAFMTWAAFAGNKRIPLILAGAFGMLPYLASLYYSFYHLNPNWEYWTPLEWYLYFIPPIISALVFLGIMVGILILGCKKKPIGSGFCTLLFSLVFACFVIEFLPLILNFLGLRFFYNNFFNILLFPGLLLFLGGILDAKQDSPKTRRLGFCIGGISLGLFALVLTFEFVGLYFGENFNLAFWCVFFLGICTAAVLLYISFLPKKGTSVSLTIPRPVKVPTYTPPIYTPPVQQMPIYPPQTPPVFTPTVQTPPIYTPPVQTPPVQTPPVFSQTPPVYPVQPAPKPGIPDLNAADAKLQQLKAMQERGLISQEDYDSMKKQLLGL